MLWFANLQETWSKARFAGIVLAGHREILLKILYWCAMVLSGCVYAVIPLEGFIPLEELS